MFAGLVIVWALSIRAVLRVRENFRLLPANLKNDLRSALTFMTRVMKVALVLFWASTMDRNTRKKVELLLTDYDIVTTCDSPPLMPPAVPPPLPL